MNKKRVALKEIITEIGDEAGGKYTWFLIGFDAQGYIENHKEMRAEIYQKN